MINSDKRLLQSPFTVNLFRRRHFALPSINSDKHLPQSPFTGKLFQMKKFYIAFYESYFSTVKLNDDRFGRSAGTRIIEERIGMSSLLLPLSGVVGLGRVTFRKRYTLIVNNIDWTLTPAFSNWYSHRVK
jgi:hypothetical protein